MNLLPSSPSIKVWVFQAGNYLSEEQKRVISTNLEEFLPNWHAHQVKLDPGYIFIGDCAVVVYNDEGYTGSSGCSIDKLINTIKAIENQINISLFNRMAIVAYTFNQWKLLTLDETINSVQNAELTLSDSTLNQAAISADQLVLQLNQSWVNKFLKQTV